MCSKFKSFNEGPQFLLEYLGYTDKEGNFIDEHLNIWPWIPGMRLQFIPRDYRRNENYHNCCELRFKASRSQIKNQIYSCTLPFFYLHLLTATQSWATTDTKTKPFCRSKDIWGLSHFNMSGIGCDFISATSIALTSVNSSTRQDPKAINGGAP